MWSIFDFILSEEIQMPKQEPNKFIAPIVIAGITAGFFMSAYKFVFAKSKPKNDQAKDAYSVNKSAQTQAEMKK